MEGWTHDVYSCTVVQLLAYARNLLAGQRLQTSSSSSSSSSYSSSYSYSYYYYSSSLIHVSLDFMSSVGTCSGQCQIKTLTYAIAEKLPPPRPPHSKIVMAFSPDCIAVLPGSGSVCVPCAAHIELQFLLDMVLLVYLPTRLPVQVMAVLASLQVFNF